VGPWGPSDISSKETKRKTEREGEESTEKSLRTQKGRPRETTKGKNEQAHQSDRQEGHKQRTNRPNDLNMGWESASTMVKKKCLKQVQNQHLCTGSNWRDGCGKKVKRTPSLVSGKVGHTPTKTSDQAGRGQMPNLAVVKERMLGRHRNLARSPLWMNESQTTNTPRKEK